METRKENVENKKSSLSIENRSKLALTGVVEVICFNENVIELDTVLGKLTIKGEGLKMNKLDVQNGEVMIVGKIDSCVYSSNESKKEKDSIIARLFK